MRVDAAVLAVTIGLGGCALFKAAPPAPAPPPPRPTATPQEPSPPSRPTVTPKDPSLPLPVLSPGVSPGDEQRLTINTQGRIEGTARLVRQIENRKLVGDQQEGFLTIQSLLAKAREALLARDVQRAFTLADKAYLLADDLVRRLK